MLPAPPAPLHTSHSCCWERYRQRWPCWTQRGIGSSSNTHLVSSCTPVLTFVVGVYCRGGLLGRRHQKDWMLAIVGEGGCRFELRRTSIKLHFGRDDGRALHGSSPLRRSFMMSGMTASRERLAAINATVRPLARVRPLVLWERSSCGRTASGTSSKRTASRPSASARAGQNRIRKLTPQDADISRSITWESAWFYRHYL